MPPPSPAHLRAVLEHLGEAWGLRNVQRHLCRAAVGCPTTEEEDEGWSGCAITDESRPSHAGAQARRTKETKANDARTADAGRITARARVDKARPLVTGAVLPLEAVWVRKAFLDMSL